MQIGEQVTYTLITKSTKAIIKITDTRNNSIIRGDKTLKKQLTTQKNKKTNNTHIATITEIKESTMFGQQTIESITLTEYKEEYKLNITISHHELLTGIQERLLILKQFHKRVYGHGWTSEIIDYKFSGGVTEEVVQELC